MDFPISRIKGGVGAPLGFLTSAVSCGIKNPAAERLDLGADLFGAPVQFGRHLHHQPREGRARPRFAVPSAQGRHCAPSSPTPAMPTPAPACRESATPTRCATPSPKPLGLKRTEVGVCSTGVIGLPMPMMRIEPKYEALISGLGPRNGPDVAAAIITSDTHAKELAISFDLGDTASASAAASRVRA
jgi:glutamate N-acetyltransferase / amino-acid N-acetyltransferase